MTSKFDQEAMLDVSQNSSMPVITIPKIDGLSQTYFVRLWLTDSDGKNVSDNFYWLSTNPVVFDWEHSSWYYTPTTQLEDFTTLKDLPEVALNGTARMEQQGGRMLVHVSLENPGKTLAFQIHLRVTDTKGEDILPAIFEDNYFPLFPGERRSVTVTFDSDKLSGSPAVFVEGWNVHSLKLLVRSKSEATGHRQQATAKTNPI
jgi:exo-1,4-beta-D-glucosaminidase